MRGEKNKSRLSRPIVVISLASIIIGVAIMIITLSVITGFQQEIRKKVIGFGSHIQITNQGMSRSMESAPILKEQEFYQTLAKNEAIKNIQVFAYKPAIIQAARDSVVFELSTQDTIRSQQDILGVLFKGIDRDYDVSFFEDKLEEGRFIDFESKDPEIIVSSYIAKLMGYQIGNECTSFFFRDNAGPKKQKFKIVGIYRSGFEEFDKKLIFTSIQHLQKINNWGVQTYLTLADTCINGRFALKGITSGGSKSYKYDWGKGYQHYEFYPLELSKNKTVQLISSDFDIAPFGAKNVPLSIADTAFAELHVDALCACNETILKENPLEYITATEIKAPFGKVLIRNGKGTGHLYVGGFEILIHEWEDLQKINDLVYNETPIDLRTTTIVEMHRDIFSWLDLLDMNILIIIALILIVSLINMVTSLLVLILEKTNMIGILKAMGIQNANIRMIFMFHALFLLSRGLLWGNILGLGLLLFQYLTGFFSLNAEVYSLDTVPVNFNLLHLIYINGITILVCFLMLIIPSYLVTKINLIKAIRFD